MQCLISSSAKSGDLLLVETKGYGPVYGFFVDIGNGQGRAFVELGCKDKSMSENMPRLTFLNKTNAACITFETPPIFELSCTENTLLNSEIDVIPNFQQDIYTRVILIQNNEAFLCCDRSSIFSTSPPY